MRFHAERTFPDLYSFSFGLAFSKAIAGSRQLHDPSLSIRQNVGPARVSIKTATLWQCSWHPTGLLVTSTGLFTPPKALLDQGCCRSCDNLYFNRICSLPK